MRINQEVGCVYDTLAYFSAFIDEDDKNMSNDKYTKLSSMYYDIKQYIVQDNISIPRYLFPFLCRKNNTDSFLHTLFFDREFSKCTIERLQKTLQNKSYMQNSFIAFSVPNTDERTINSIAKMENPDIIDMLTERYTERVLGSYFFYILANFEKVMFSLNKVVQAVYSKMETLRQSMLPGICSEALKRDAVFHKLRAITNANDVNENNFTISLSLIDSDILTYRPDELNFVLLGCNFEKKLDSDYKYCEITPYSFARAISNPAKNDIFNALLHHSPMTATGLSNQLCLSRNEVSYNIQDMMKAGLLISEPINKRTYQYRIDYEYLRVVSRQLDSILRFN